MTSATELYVRRMKQIEEIVQYWEAAPAADRLMNILAEVHEEGFREGLLAGFQGLTNAPSRNKSLYRKGLLSLKHWRMTKERYDYYKKQFKLHDFSKSNSRF